MKPIVTDISDKPGLVLDTTVLGERMMTLAKDEQEKINEYNAEVEALKEGVHPAFEDKRFINQNIVVRLYKMDRVVEGKFFQEKFHKIPIQGQAGQDIMIKNPLPYKFRGVIVALDPKVTANISDLTVGAEVEISPGNSLQDSRYYLTDEGDVPISREDLIAGMDPFPNHEGYFMLKPGDIECVIG